jgi:hypothetical protein
VIRLTCNTKLYEATRAIFAGFWHMATRRIACVRSEECGVGPQLPISWPSTDLAAIEFFGFISGIFSGASFPKNQPSVTFSYVCAATVHREPYEVRHSSVKTGASRPKN